MAALGDWSRLLRAAALGGLVLLAAWWTLLLRGRLAERERELAESQRRIAERDERIGRLEGVVAEQERRIRELQAALRLLKVDHRLARLQVLEQRPAAARPGLLETRVRFQEVAPGGAPLGPARDYALLGAVAYVDALVIKFEDAYVERGDALRGTSVCLFRRLFGEHQEPSQGFPLDAVGVRPVPYSDGSAETAAGSYDAELWERFWDYANDPEAARARGVRAIHGEAPFMELRPGASYLLELRASGGLSIRPE